MILELCVDEERLYGPGDPARREGVRMARELAELIDLKPEKVATDGGSLGEAGAAPRTMSAIRIRKDPDSAQWRKRRANCQSCVTGACRPSRQTASGDPASGLGGGAPASLRSHASAWATIVSMSAWAGASRASPASPASRRPAAAGRRRAGPSISRRIGWPAPVDRVEHFEHRQASAVAAVEHEFSPARAISPSSASDMRGGKVGDVDVVAHAGSVGRRIVGPVDRRHGRVCRPPPRPRP